VHVEVSLASGLPVFCIVGLPAMVVKESKERVRAALLNSRFEFPAGRITVSLAPADLPKEGGRFDLPIALGILLASGQIRAPAETGGTGVAREFYGELGLTGELKPVRGLLLAATHAARHGHELVVPRANAAEVCAVAPAQVRAAGHLLEVCAHLTGAAPLSPCPLPQSHARRRDEGLGRGVPLDLADVRGQLQAKRALIIAAAGAHSLLKLDSIRPREKGPNKGRPLGLWSSWRGEVATTFRHPTAPLTLMMYNKSNRGAILHHLRSSPKR
jgi:magnesium chelatase family protein